MITKTDVMIHLIREIAGQHIYIQDIIDHYLDYPADYIEHNLA